MVATFGLDAADTAISHAAKHGGPYERTVLTPVER
jgi:hypothetical protein